MTILFGGMTRAELDLAYDNRNKVEGFDFDAFLVECQTRNDAALQAHRSVMDVSFGASDAEALDIFLPESCETAPVHVFFHGGYWRALNKADFSYVANGIVPNGHILVVVNYALIPTVRMDELIEQCRRSLRWVQDNIAEYGGDPARISISGHSAGGHIVAMMMATDWQGTTPFVQACAISGIYELEPVRLCHLNDDLDLSEQEVEHQSPVRLPRGTDVPFSVLVGEREGPEYIRQSRALAEAWSSDAAPVPVTVDPDHDHFSIRMALDNPDSAVTQAVLFP